MGSWECGCFVVVGVCWWNELWGLMKKDGFKMLDSDDKFFECMVFGCG